jgi:predicted nucleic acid-binding protein
LSIVPSILLKKVTSTNTHWYKANKLVKKLKTPLTDTVHTIIANEMDAVLVTRDKHFYEFQDIANVKKPEDLLYM